MLLRRPSRSCGLVPKCTLLGTLNLRQIFVVSCAFLPILSFLFEMLMRSITSQSFFVFILSELLLIASHTYYVLPFFK